MTTASWIVVATVVVVILVGFLLVPHNLRRWRVARQAARMDIEARQRAIALITRANKAARSSTLMWPCEGSLEEGELLVHSRLGGQPYAEAGESWPQAHEGDPPEAVPPAVFLLQVRLVHSDLPDVWRGRLLTVYMRDDEAQEVRSYADPSPAGYHALAGGPPARPSVLLEPVPLPSVPDDDDDDDDPTDPFTPAYLIDKTPELESLLREYSQDPAALLAMVLCPGHEVTFLEASEVIFQGGRPSYIQNPHEAICEVCRKPMRFLFQFGDIVPGVTLADCGVGYVYGCDDHPDHCSGLIDSH